MKILHVTTYDAGGATRAAERLHRGLIRLGRASALLVCEKHGRDPAVRRFSPPMDPWNRIRRRIRRELIAREHARWAGSRPPGYERFSDDRSQYAETVLPSLAPADVVHLHWISGFVDYASFFGAPDGSRGVVWTMHDMNAFTGGCHYDLGCGRYNIGCGACPQLGSRDGHDLSRNVWSRKKRVFDRLSPDRLHLVAVNGWMAGELAGSALLGRFPVTVIPPGLDTDEFAPRDRTVSREIFGIPRGARVVLFVAESIDNRRKGFALLDRVFGSLEETAGVVLVSLGLGEPGGTGGGRRLHLGYLDRDRLLSYAYSAADVFVIPSLQDNSPNTVLEAMACGTPVVGFAVGGIPDMVRPGVAGTLVSPGDIGALGRAIDALLADAGARERMGANCRRIVLEEYSMETQARRYLALYEALRREGGSPGGC